MSGRPNHSRRKSRLTSAQPHSERYHGWSGRTSQATPSSGVANPARIASEQPTAPSFSSTPDTGLYHLPSPPGRFLQSRISTRGRCDPRNTGESYSSLTSRSYGLASPSPDLLGPRTTPSPGCESSRQDLHKNLLRSICLALESQ